MNMDSAKLSLIDLPTIVIYSIFNWLEDDEDKVFLYLTCKRLHHYKYLTLEHYSDRNQCAHGPVERYKKVTLSGVSYYSSSIGSGSGSGGGGGGATTTIILPPKHERLYNRLKERSDRSLVTMLSLYYCSNDKNNERNVLVLDPLITCLVVDGQRPNNLLNSKNTYNLSSLTVSKGSDYDSVLRTKLGMRGDTHPNLIQLDLPVIKITSHTNNLNVGGHLLPSSLTSLSVNFSIQNGGRGMSTVNPIVDYFSNLDQSLVHLTLSLDVYDTRIKFNRFPSNLVSLSLNGFNQQLERDMFPPTTLTSLSLDEYHKLIPTGTLPNSLLRLEIKECCPDCLKGTVLPPTLTTLLVHGSLRSITVPNSVTTLIYSFKNGIVNGCGLVKLPTSLLHAEFINHFDQGKLGLKLPQGLQTLRISPLNCLEPGFIPNTVHSIQIDDFSLFNNNINNNTCNNNTQPTKLGWIPDSVESIVFKKGFDHSIRYPSGLKYIEFGESFTGRSFKTTILASEYLLPFGVETVKFGSLLEYDTLVKGVLPQSITRLYFTNVRGVLASLTTGFLGEFHQLPKDFTFPPRLEVLQFPLAYEYEMPRLPNTLLKLYLYSPTIGRNKCSLCPYWRTHQCPPLPTTHTKLINLPNYPLSMVIYIDNTYYTIHQYQQALKIQQQQQQPKKFI
ncbi:hypothetical protein DFA_06044 [Cavenderia fasciculata]|uniref:Uncharacterized protein n=1 Tax=Cavenderia fasciculata TaxID=261658 RepID=F4PJY2_CACFS|nr:uncharacterized protein DFA_06044 [Cavenderia fasciculata]EGG23906.1 hypothetical protein DFA_06044 [Cavenderia fasciculata]|eukprot:XP_004361757.1 hypothetical protein DFA_06044 [Cavenderia fasciculata]